MSVNIYDDFNQNSLDANKWNILAFPDGNGSWWRYEDPNMKNKIENNTFFLEVNPFSKKNYDVAIFDNPKHLYASTSTIKSPDKGVLNISAEIAFETFNNVDNELRDAFASFHIMDFKNGMVIDFIGNNKKVGIIYERLLLPGITNENTAFTDVVELRVPTKPRQFHKCVLSYNKEKDYASFNIDNINLFEVNNIPVKVDDWTLGIGVCTLDRMEKPLHDQGAGLKIKNIHYWNS